MCVQDSTFLSNFVGHVGNIEIFNVQLPQVGKLAEFSWKLSNSSIAVGKNVGDNMIEQVALKVRGTSSR